MDGINSFLKDYMNGNNWEDLCVKCYRIRYQNDNYTAIPATNGGDAGIEGFTNKGIVHQCYCPERNYSDNELYEHQRNKLSTDIDKLKKNGTRLYALGVPPIIEWHFNIPDYKDSRILAHAEVKRQEIINAKKENPSGYVHISDDFQIAIKTAKDFTPEISRIIRENLANVKINAEIKHNNEIDWTKCDSVKVENIRRKIKAVMLVDDMNDSLDRVVEIYISCYINGMEIMNNLRANFPEIYEDVFNLEQSYKSEVAIKTLMNTDKKMNSSLFNEILNDFQANLEHNFTPMFTSASIFELKRDLVASWLADCSMEFRS